MGVPISGPGSEARPILRYRLLHLIRWSDALSLGHPFFRLVERWARRVGLLRRETDYAFVASFPRSGNHWVRYIVETITGHPTLGEADGFHPQDSLFKHAEPPIHARIGRRPSSNSPVLVKRHVFSQHDDRERPVLLVVRDPIEAIASHVEYRMDAVRIERAVHTFRTIALQIRDWRGPVHATYLAHLMSVDTTIVSDAIGDLLTFLGFSGFQERVDEFIEELPGHRLTSEAALYREPLRYSASATSDSADLVREYIRDEVAQFALRHPDAARRFLG